MRPLAFQKPTPERRPVAALIALNAATFLICLVGQILFSKNMTSLSPQDFLGLPSLLHRLARMPWTPITYMITHTDILHLIFNMLWLFWFGDIITAVRTPAKVLILYVTGGIAGAAAYITDALVSPYSHTLYGASASILALMAYAAIIVPDIRVRLIIFGEVKLKWLASACILLAFIGIGGSSLPAHLGGSAAGLIAALAEKRRRHSDTTRHFSHTDVKRFKKAAVKAVQTDRERLDSLLDKIRLSGFEALSDREKDELKSISRKLENHKK